MSRRALAAVRLSPPLELLEDAVEVVLAAWCHGGAIVRLGELERLTRLLCTRGFRVAGRRDSERDALVTAPHHVRRLALGALAEQPLLRRAARVERRVDAPLVARDELPRRPQHARPPPLLLVAGVGDEQPVGAVLDLALPRALQVADVLGQRRPDGRVHVHVVAVGDVLGVHDVCADAHVAVAAAHELHERAVELLREVAHELLRVLREQHHHPLVPLALAVALEPVLVAALLLAHLAVPAELLEGLCLGRGAVAKEGEGELASCIQKVGILVVRTWHALHFVSNAWTVSYLHAV